MNKNKRNKVVKEIEHHNHRVYREWDMDTLVFFFIMGSVLILGTLVSVTNLMLLNSSVDKSLVWGVLGAGGLCILMGVFFGWALGDLKTFQGY